MQPQRGNLLISHLSRTVQERLANGLVPAYFPLGTELTEGGDIVFPLTCVVSLLRDLPDGHATESALIGFDGLYEIRAAGVRAIVQVAGEALTMRREFFVEAESNEEFRSAVELYRDQVLGITMQSAACGRFHKTEGRLAFWLLALYARSGSIPLSLTHDFLAMMLGVQRPTISLAARQLQDQGVISYGYGRVIITDPVGLAQLSCGCEDPLQRFVSPANATSDRHRRPARHELAADI